MNFRFNAALLSLAALGGCATGKIESIPFPSSANPNQEIAKFESQLIDDAGEDDVDVLSSHYYQLASTALTETKKLRADGRPHEEVLDRLADARSYLVYAEKRAATARILLKDVRETRSTAVALDVGTFLYPDLDHVDLKFLAIAHSIEDGEETVSPEDTAKLIQAYKGLTVRAVRIASVNGPIQLMKEAVNEGAPEKAPITLAETKKAIIELDEQIHRDATQSEQIQTLSAFATEKANLLVRLVKKSKTGAGESETRMLQTEKAQQIESHFTPAEALVQVTGDQITIHLHDDQLPLLEKAKQAILDLGGTPRIIVNGFAEANSSSNVVLQLSLARAVSVKSFLMTSLSQSEIEAHGRGLAVPSADESPEARAFKRRVDIIISPN